MRGAASRAGTPVRRWDRRRSAATTWSVAATGLGLWWCLRPQDSPFTPGDDGFTTALRLVSPVVAGTVLVTAGLVGLATLLVGRGTAVVAAAHVLLFGLVAPGQAPIAVAGYLMAMLGPWVLLATVAVGSVRWRRGRLVLAAFAVVGVLAFASGLVDTVVLERYAAIVAGSAGQLGAPALCVFLLLGGVVWAIVGFGDRGPGPFALRYGRPATYLAAACVLPYGVLRMTWLTPWPIGGDAALLAAEPEIRLHGLLLGLAALAGGVLTLGLIARWGEVWPAFVPVLRGRPVPIPAAAVPGLAVAALVTSAAPTTVVQVLVGGDRVGLLVFPFWLWGPALGVAVAGYAARRRAGRGDGSPTDTYRTVW